MAEIDPARSSPDTGTHDFRASKRGPLCVYCGVALSEVDPSAKCLHAPKADTGTPPRGELLQKAIKLLEALESPHDYTVSADGDHNWRTCRRCLAAAQFDYSHPEDEQNAVSDLIREVLAALSPLPGAASVEAAREELPNFENEVGALQAAIRWNISRVRGNSSAPTDECWPQIKALIAVAVAHGRSTAQAEIDQLTASSAHLAQEYETTLAIVRADRDRQWSRAEKAEADLARVTADYEGARAEDACKIRELEARLEVARGAYLAAQNQVGGK